MLISGENYIIAIWKLFSQKKSLSDVQSGNKSGHVAALAGIHSDLNPCLVLSLHKREKKNERALKRLTQRSREGEKVIERGWGGEYFP